MKKLLIFALLLAAPTAVSAQADLCCRATQSCNKQKHSSRKDIGQKAAHHTDRKMSADHSHCCKAGKADCCQHVAGSCRQAKKDIQNKGAHAGHKGRDNR